MKKLLILFCAVSFCINLFATSLITIGEEATTNSYILPITIDGVYGPKYSISQQIYLASELTAEGASEGDITAITFYYSHTDNVTNTRSLEVWMMETTLSEFPMTADDPGKLVYNSSYKAGTKVFDGSVELHKDNYTITFNSGGNKFHWGGSNNILLTVYDKTGTGLARQRHVLMATSSPRFLHKKSSMTPLTDWNINDLYNTPADSYKSSSSEITGHKWVNKITFTFAGASAPATPTDLSAETTNNSATLSWSSVAGATLYKLQSSSNGSDWSELASTVLTSYDWTGLASETTYYVRIAASNASGDSDWSDAVAFTTDAVHSHDGITFAKWNSTNDIPSSGNYYLANDITIGGASRKTINGTLNLCLNGHTITFGQYTGMDIRGYGSVGTLALYDDVGGGLITGAHNSYTILVEGDDGSLSIHGGRVENSGAGVPISSDGHVTFDLLENVSNYATIAMADGVSNISIHMDRSFTSSQFNTICLPFTLYSDKLSSIFGSGYDLEEFVSSELIGEELVLNFTKVTQLDGGKPYLIKPAHNVVNPTFSGVDISALSPIDNTSDPYISFHGVFSPTELEGGNKNLLFLGANDELFWPAATGDLKGFRSYFEVKGAAQKVAKRASIIRNPGEAQGLQTPSLLGKSGEATKCIRDGRLIIERDGQLYNAQGIRIQ